MTRFCIQTTAAFRDLPIYKVLTPDNIDYNFKDKSFILGPSFKHLFDFPVERVLSWLSRGFGDGVHLGFRRG